MKNSKSGVAVIIVLGLLALLMVLGVSFTVTMRGERAGSANYLASTASRHMVWAGIARGIDAVNQTMDGSMFPPGDYLVSGSGTWNSHPNTGVALLTRQVRGYVPDTLLDFLEDQDEPVRASWTSLPGGGRAAYLVLNLSDMLDANHVGGEQRAGGRAVSELMLATNVLTVAEYADLITSRSSAGGSFDNPPAFRSQAPDVPYELFSTFTRYLPDSNRTNLVYVGGDASELEANRSAIESAMVENFPEEGGAGATSISAAQAARIFDQLLEYVSEEEVPSDLERPNAKPVPMINEVVAELVRIGVGGDPGQFAMIFQPHIDAWYPYIRQSDSNFVIEGEYSLTVEELPEGISITNQNTFTSGTINQPERNGTHHGFYSPTIEPVMVGPEAGATATNTFNISLGFSNVVVRLSDGDIVDQVNGTFRYEMQWTSTMASDDIGWEPETYQVSDPRFNWTLPDDINVQSPWQISNPPGEAPGGLTPSIGQTNAWTAFFLAQRELGQPGIQKGSEMHAGGNGYLYSPLEFGHILLLPNSTLSHPANYWRNVRVFDHADNVRRHRILETFTTNQQFPQIEDGEDDAYRGLVNINTVENRILRTLFAEMPYPYVGANAIESEYPERLDAVLSVIQDHMDDQGEFRSVVELLDLDWRGHPALADLSDLELTALLAYAVELAGVRHNLFLIVSTATAMEGGGNIVRGRRNAMAIVWRDPVPNGDGLHDQFIQYFRWLD